MSQTHAVGGTQIYFERLISLCLIKCRTAVATLRHTMVHALVKTLAGNGEKWQFLVKKSSGGACPGPFRLWVKYGLFYCGLV